jgi:hypothetical protein
LGAASLLLFGLIIGLAAGLYYAWMVEPVTYVAAGPARLSEENQGEYILMVSQSYAVDGDWERAKERLDLLGDPNIADTVSSQLEQYLRDGRPADNLNMLATIAGKLGARSPVVSLFVPEDVDPAILTPREVGVSPTMTLLPTATSTSRATRSATASPTPTDEPSTTPVPVYRLLKQEKICRRNTPIPLIEVAVYDAFLDPIQGMEVIVKWDEGSDHFFTGYHPGIGEGFGDFTMDPETVYSVELAAGSIPVGGFQIENCGTELGGLAGGWRLTYQSTEIQE